MHMKPFLRVSPLVLLIGLSLVATSCSQTVIEESTTMSNVPINEAYETDNSNDQSRAHTLVADTKEEAADSKLKTATFGAGCFWCVEAVFQELDGVESVESGYSGGKVKNPTYEQVCTGRTGHAEVIQLRYDPSKVSFEELLEVFWKTHDPTTLNKQGPDTGTQYRSAVFYHDDEQKQLAEQYKKKLDESGAFRKKIVTEISPFTEFYKAEAYHQNFFRNNPRYGYCQAIIQPKMDKFRKVFSDKLKMDE